jgi:prepilin-type N-terminal cleavage/methylation domain-containing protein
MSSRGFSLLEAVVVLALVSIVMLAAAGLIVQSLRLLEGTGRSLRDTSFTTASVHMRRDVHSAAGLRLAGLGWAAGPLELDRHQGGWIRIEPHAGRLERVEIDAAGREVGRRVLLHRLRRFRWQALAGSLVEIEVTLSVHRDPWQAALTPEPGGDASEVERVERLLLAVRGGRSW